MRYFIGDTETTGLKRARPVEIAFVEIDPESLEILASCESLIDPEKEITPEAQAIHGISAEMVADAPTVSEFVEVILKGRIEGPCTLIGYNVQFDKPMFDEVMDISQTFCALALCRRLYPTQTKDHKLGTMAEHLGLDSGEAHRAMSDVLTVHQMLRVVLPYTGKSLQAHLDTPAHDIYTMPFGEHKGKRLADLPAGYRVWLLSLDNLDPDLKRSLHKLRAAGM